MFVYKMAVAAVKALEVVFCLFVFFFLKQQITQKVTSSSSAVNMLAVLCLQASGCQEVDPL